MKPIIAITMGDPAGIGAEIVVKALALARIHQLCVPVVIADHLPMQHAIDQVGLPLVLRTIDQPEDAQGAPGILEVIDLGVLQGKTWQYGQIDPACGEAAFQYILCAIRLAREDRVQAVVTGPIHKEAIHLAGHDFPGHTEILTAYTEAKQSAMMLCNGDLRVVHVTTHLAMREACEKITKERVYETIVLAQQALDMLGTPRKSIAVAGLNPHSSEGGLFGDEEYLRILPAIEKARAQGLCVEGPVPPDTVFVKALAGQYDIVVAMYHDQGHIPLKLCGFRLDAESGLFTAMQGVNVTLGLPIIRTSVDHGTAFDRAGKNISNEESMVEAIEMAARMAVHRTGGGPC